MTTRLTILGVAILALGGCCTTTIAEYKHSLDPLLFSHMDELIEVWGPPDSHYRLSSGDLILQYEDRRTGCMTRFTVDKANLVTRYAFDRGHHAPLCW